MNEETGVAGVGQLVDVDRAGWVGIKRDGVLEHSYLYAGVRVAVLGPDPRDPNKEVVSVLGGIQDQDDVVADGVTFTISQAGLRALAADLLAAADRVRARTVIDLRQIV